MGTCRYGMPVGGPLQAVGPLAKAIEDGGFDSPWTTETTSNPFIQAALVAQATSRVRIGTGIALAFPRSPASRAMTAVDLDELSEGGRFALGLRSPGDSGVNEQRFSTLEHRLEEAGVRPGDPGIGWLSRGGARFQALYQVRWRLARPAAPLRPAVRSCSPP